MALAAAAYGRRARRPPQRVEQHHGGDERRLDPRRQLDQFLRQARQAVVARQRRAEGQQVHRQQDAQHDAEVAEVRQARGLHVLPYTHSLLCTAADLERL